MNEREILVTRLGLLDWKAEWSKCPVCYTYYGFGLTRWGAIRSLRAAIKRAQTPSERVPVDW